MCDRLRFTSEVGIVGEQLVQAFLGETIRCRFSRNVIPEISEGLDVSRSADGSGSAPGPPAWPAVLLAVIGLFHWTAGPA